MIIVPLRFPSCKLKLARFSVKLKFQDGPSVAILTNLTAVFTLLLRSVVRLVVFRSCSSARFNKTVFAEKGSISEDDLTFKYFFSKLYKY